MGGDDAIEPEEPTTAEPAVDAEPVAPVDPFEAVFAAAATVADPAQVAPSDRRTTLIGAAGLLVVVLLIGVLAAVTRGDDGDDDVRADEPVASTTTLPGLPNLGPASSPSTVPGSPLDPTSTTTARGSGTGTTGGATSGGATTGPPATTTTLANAQPIRIGNVGTYSGPLAPIYSPGKQVLEAWAESVNAVGGVGGHRVELVVRDDRGDFARHLALVKELVEQERVVAFVGNQSPASGSVARYLEGVNVPLLGGDGLSTAWNSSPMLFPLGDGPVGQAFSLVELATASEADSIAILSCEEFTYCSDGAGVAAQATPLFGGTVSYRATISHTQPDFVAECSAAAAAGAKAVIVFADAAAASRVLSSCGIRLVIASVLSVATGVSDSGVLSSTPILPPSAAGAAGAGYRALTAGLPGFSESYAASVGYLSGKLLERAAALGGWPASVTSADVLRGLRAMRADTLGGLTAPLTYGSSAAPPARCGFPLLSNGTAWSVLTTTPRCF